MAMLILDSTTLAAVEAATSQQEQCEALITAWSGGNVTARLFNSAATLLRTLTLEPFTIDSSTNPRKVVCGAVVADTHVSTGTPSKVVFRFGATDIFSMDAGVNSASISFPGTIKEFCSPDLDAVTFDASSLLLPMGEFDSVTYLGTDANAPHTTSDQYFVLELHASGGSTTTTGTRYSATCSDLLADPDGSAFLFSTARGFAVSGVNVTLLRPVDNYGLYPSLLRKESYWMGFMPTSGADLELITEARLDALMDWAATNVPNCSTTQRYCRGGSMGAWGTMTYATRRPDLFAAIYPDRPRVRYNNSSNSLTVPEWTTVPVTYSPVTTAPDVNVRWDIDSIKNHMDLVAYVADTNNRIPWIGWVIGSTDGFSIFSDHIALVAAMRSAKRGFAFWWDAGGHAEGTRMTNITASYPLGLFKLGEGYPLFENHSLDDDPSVDATGGINIGLTFRNVSESASSWSCEVTNINAACTVDVSPISETYTGSLTPKSVTIPAANTWVAVNFP